MTSGSQKLSAPWSPKTTSKLADRNGKCSPLANARGNFASAARPKSSFAVTGIYVLDGTAPARARALTPSARGELEIVDVLNAYLAEGALSVEKMGRGFAWLDTGTHASLLDAGNFVRTIEERQNFKIGCPEEIAFTEGWIDAAALRALAQPYLKTDYGRYLLRIADGA